MVNYFHAVASTHISRLVWRLYTTNYHRRVNYNPRIRARAD